MGPGSQGSSEEGWGEEGTRTGLPGGRGHEGHPGRSPRASSANRRSQTGSQRHQGAREGLRCHWPREDKRLREVSSKASSPGGQLLAQVLEQDRRHAPRQAEGTGRGAQACTWEGSVTGAGRGGRSRGLALEPEQRFNVRGTDGGTEWAPAQEVRRVRAAPGRLEPGLGAQCHRYPPGPNTSHGKERLPSTRGGARPGPARRPAPQPFTPGQASRRISPAGFVSQAQCHFQTRHPALEMRPAAKGETAVSPKHSQGAASQSQPRPWQKQGWQGSAAPADAGTGP